MDAVRLDDIRLTVVDEEGTVSFVAHASAAVALTAACSHNPTRLRDLLDASERYDRALRTIVLRGLAVFDEHNLPGELSHIHTQLDQLPPRKSPVFRVLDPITREASLQPVRAGVVLYNLPARRIVQIENTYEPLAQSGEVNYHNGRFLSMRLLPYQLAADWMIVP
ncbi:MAG TPA: hypothetical protein VID72_05420 [Ktedonobacterales bacterium]|jgi:hypothetical protein